MSFWVYILRCSDGAYYTGHTDDLEARVSAHASGQFHGNFTSSRLPVRLVWSEALPTRDEALRAERQINGWTHAVRAFVLRQAQDERGHRGMPA